jgi:biopolymer transport protein ExbD
MGMKVGGDSGGAVADINMIPLIDVLLVLLIIFMVITPLTPKGLEALIPQPPPKDAPPPQGPDRTVVIIINKDRSMMLNTEPVTEANLQTRLLDVFKTRAERVCFVKGDPDLEFQYVARAIDIAKGAQMDKVGLMTAKMEAGE